MNDELTRWADAARDYKAKLDWATTALSDILELASGNKCDPDYTALEGLIAGTIESVRALKAELEQAHKACAEMRDCLQACKAMVTNHINICKMLDRGTNAWPDLLTGCVSGGGIEHALSTDSGKDYVHKSQEVERLREALKEIADVAIGYERYIAKAALEKEAK